MTFAGGSVLEDVLTLEMKVNYVRPGVGGKLIARASVLSHGRSQAVCRCDVMISDKIGEEKICVAAQGTISSTKSASM
ncbi:PaaI family thioesterase [Labrenzia sp. DG1229]|uniref:PaaI family thioesterase n=1 Tax=Labrenzia sp. DG1229 TaxID=681847 RepID=UPI00336A05D4